MTSNTTIQWTEKSWNPVTGCDKTSAGCKNCYAEKFCWRHQHNPKLKHKYFNGFKLTTHEYCLVEPSRIKKPSLIFVNSMSDLFHKDVPVEFIMKVFDVMNKANWHTYQILTKRSERLLELDKLLPWAPNIWMGCSVENNGCLFRIDHLKATHAKIKFLSLEPLLGPLPDLKLDGINWVIVGGESGPGWRPMEKEWVLDILAKCRQAKVPFFFKQWAGLRKKVVGRLLNGRTYDEMPEIK